MSKKLPKFAEQYLVVSLFSFVLRVSDKTRNHNKCSTDTFIQILQLTLFSIGGA